ncbi:putative Ig domain-containing protein [Bacterioplanoides sp.]|uniref:putative Ig domain-containing protein n=1 Tax=Bacterioplanoides sp. TaxID=2066072 RepID=UPI003B00E2A8
MEFTKRALKGMTPLAFCIAAANSQVANADCDIVVTSLVSANNPASINLDEAINFVVGAQITPGVVFPDNCTSPFTISFDNSLAGMTDTVSAAPAGLDGGKVVIIDGIADNPITLQFSDAGATFLNVTESASLTIGNMNLSGRENITRTASLFSVDNSNLTIEDSVIDGFEHNLNPLLTAFESSTTRIIDSRITNNLASTTNIATIDGTLEIQDSTLSNNTASSAAGGVMSTTRTDLTITNSVFEDNTSLADNRQSGGGAMAFSFSDADGGSVTIRESAFRRNRANNRGGALLHDLSGGRSQTLTDVRIIIEDTVFEDNEALQSSTSTFVSGGALYITGSADLHIDRSTFGGNSADTLGGAVYLAGFPIDAENGQVSITDTTFASNESIRGGAMAIRGGQRSLTVVTDRSTYRGNTAISTGGAIEFSGANVSLQLISSTFDGNTAGAGGSVLDFESGNASIQHSTLTNNTVTSLSGSPHLLSASRPNQNIEISHTIMHGNIGSGPSVGVSGSEFTAALDFTYWDGTFRGDTQIEDNGGNIVSSDDPGLGALQNNGGETETRMPAADSPLVDAGDPNIMDDPATDQRGSERIMRGMIDIGSVENGNMPPVGTVPDAATVSVNTAIDVDASVWFDDPEGDSITFAIAGAPNELSIDASTGAITGTAATVGDFTITVTATDQFGASSSVVYSLSIAVNRPPVGTVPDAATVDAGTVINVDASAWFTDPEGDDLTFSFSGAPAELSIEADSGVISGTAATAGDFTITVTATDAFGASAATTLSLTIQAPIVDEPENNASEDDSSAGNGSPVQDNSPAEDSNASGGSSGGVLFWLLGLLPLALISRRR